MSAYIGIMLAPLVAVFLIACARYVSVRLYPRLPEGVLKKILYFRWES